MRNLVNLVLALCLTCSSFSALAFDFKGLTIGADTSPEAIESVLGGAKYNPVKCGYGASSMVVCNGLSSIANVTANINAVIDAQGKLARIFATFSERSFDEVKDQMIIKYGKKGLKETTEHLQNGYGAVFQQQLLTWKDSSDNWIVLTKYSGGTQNSSVHFSAASDPSRVKTSTRSSDL